MTTSYVCDNGHTFTHTAKKIQAADPEKGLYSMVGPLMMSNASLETSVCPFCQSLSYKEAPEDTIKSIKSVELDKVDALLAEGYVVHELYAKTATLVKKEA